MVDFPFVARKRAVVKMPWAQALLVYAVALTVTLAFYAGVIIGAVWLVKTAWGWF